MKNSQIVSFKLILCLVLFTNSIVGLSQTVRYRDRVFNSINVSTDVQYGNQPQLQTPYLDESNTSNVNLLMDIHTPNGDTEINRPAIIFVHGGAFVSGDKSHDDMKALCDSFALRGYVTATIDYRLGMNTTSDKSATRAVYRSLQDGRAAIRFLRANAATYGIDPNKIYMAGSSAGAFIALHQLFMNEESEIPTDAETYSYTYPITTYPYIENAIAPDLGAYDIGENLTENAIPNAIFSLWGAVKNTSLIAEADLKPIFLVHGTTDDIVPFGTGAPFSVPTFPATYGSSSINSAIDVIGYNEKDTYFVDGQGHEFYGVTNGNWDPSPNAYWDTIVNLAVNFFFKVQFSPDENGIIYVSHDATGDGSSWANATGNLQAAINAFGVNEVWVENGEYYPNQLIDLESTNPRMQSIIMKDGVDVYGGFIGSETSIDARVLDIDNLQTEITSFSVVDSEKSYHIVVFDTVGMAIETILDGFKITNGNADDMVNAAHHFGGGIIASPNAIITNCYISDNKAEIGAGVVYYAGGLVENCKITNNTASLQGGGLAILYNGAVKNSNVSSNTADSRGAGIYAEGFTALVENCFITDNNSNAYGGGVYFRDVLSAFTTGCYVNSNTATTSGGGLYAYNSILKISSSTITQNTAVSGYGGGLNSFEGASVIIENSIFTDNTAITENNIYECSTDCSISATYSGIQGGYLGENNIDLTSEDLIANYRIYDGVDDVYSPSQCLNSGNTSVVDSESFDIDGNPRVNHGIVDMGAFESTTCKGYDLTSENTTGHGVVSPSDTIIYYKNDLAFVIYPEEGWTLLTAEYNTTSVFDQMSDVDNNYYYTIENIVGNGHLVVSLENLTNTNQFEINNISVFPNPASNFISIESEYVNLEFKLFDITGKLIIDNNLNSKLQIIDVSKLQSGIYYYQLIHNDILLKNEKLIVK